MILINNYFTTRTKDFKKIINQVNKNNLKIEELNENLIEEKEKIQKLKEDNQKLLQKISSKQILLKIITFIINIYYNKFLNEKFKVQLETPFKINKMFRKFLQGGVQDPSDYDLSPRIFNMLYNYAIKSLINRILTVKIPRAQFINNPLMKMFGVNNEDLKIFDKFSQMFS